MKQYLLAISKIVLWLVIVIGFLHFVTLAADNTHSFTPNWFSGDRNYCRQDCSYTVGYTNIGFPIQIDGSSTSGMYWLAWLINLSFAAIVSFALGWLLLKRIKVGLGICIILLIYFGFLYFSV